MKTKVVVMLVGFLVAMPCLVLARTDNCSSKLTYSSNCPATPQEGTPDLLIKEIVFEPSASKIRVRIQNRGNGTSSSCYLALQSLADNSPALGTEQRVWTIQIPALAAGKGYSNVIDVSPLKHANGPWRATVDRSNEVKESNENNNVLTYPMRNPGPVPPRRRPG